MNFIHHRFRDMSTVERWGIMNRINRQSVAEHTMYVVAYAMELRNHVPFRVRVVDLVEYALSHDYGETATGDIPGPAKSCYVRQDDDAINDRTQTDLEVAAPPLDVNIVRLVKCADLMDEYYHLSREVSLGNRQAHYILTGEGPESLISRLTYRLQATNVDNDFITEILRQGDYIQESKYVPVGP